MATNMDFIEYIMECVVDFDARYRKMFGEYMVYISDKPILLVCDNTVFVKILPCIEELMQDADKGVPYTGAKEHYILDMDDSELVQKVITELEKVIPIPKKKKS